METGFHTNMSNKHQDENKNGVLVSDNSQQLICALECVGQQSSIPCDRLACKSVRPSVMETVHQSFCVCIQCLDLQIEAKAMVTQDA